MRLHEVRVKNDRVKLKAMLLEYQEARGAMVYKRQGDIMEYLYDSHIIADRVCATCGQEANKVIFELKKMLDGTASAK